MKEPVKVALIGCGAIAPAHAQGLVNNPKVKLAALYNRNIAKAVDLNDKFKLDAKLYDDYDKLLFESDVRAVIICLPPAQHCQFTIKALHSGRHVLVEKPMARSPLECRIMQKCAEAHNLTLGVIAQNRYKDPVFKLKQCLKEQILGKVNSVYVNSLWWRGGNYYDMAWRGTWAVEGGGALMSHACHQLDMMIYLLGMPLSVQAHMCNLTHDNSECEDTVSAVFEYDGFEAFFNCSLNYHEENQDIVVQCDKGMLKIPYALECYEALPNGYPVVNAKLKEKVRAFYEALPGLPLHNHEAQIANFIDAVRGEAPLEITAQDGCNVIDLINAIYYSAVKGCKVALPLDPNLEVFDTDKRVKFLPHFYEKHLFVESKENLAISLGADSKKNEA